MPMATMRGQSQACFRSVMDQTASTYGRLLAVMVQRNESYTGLIESLHNEIQVLRKENRDLKLELKKQTSDLTTQTLIMENISQTVPIMVNSVSKYACYPTTVIPTSSTTKNYSTLDDSYINVIGNNSGTNVDDTSSCDTVAIEHVAKKPNSGNNLKFVFKGYCRLQLSSGEDNSEHGISNRNSNEFSNMNGNAGDTLSSREISQDNCSDDLITLNNKVDSVLSISNESQVCKNTEHVFFESTESTSLRRDKTNLETEHDATNRINGVSGSQGVDGKMVTVNRQSNYQNIPIKKEQRSEDAASNDEIAKLKNEIAALRLQLQTYQQETIDNNYMHNIKLSNLDQLCDALIMEIIAYRKASV